jgi:ribosomal protein L11 methylase PrmA
LSLSKFQLTAIIDGLHSFISKLSWKPEGFEWGNYYNETNYSDESTKHKREIVKHFFSKVPQGLVYDIGGNNGTYSRLASDTGRETVCFDIDPAAVEKDYLAIKNSNERMLLPLIMDITNPSPGIGWGNEERNSFFKRGNAETVMALALIHHLAISNNIPLEKIAETFQALCKYCIVEWIPKEDSQVQRLLSTRKDIFQNYTQEYFEACFKKSFCLIDKIQITKTLRYLYLFKAK